MFLKKKTVYDWSLKNRVAMQVDTKNYPANTDERKKSQQRHNI
jgi:hypothetical protein